MVWNYTIPQVFKYWRFIDIPHLWRTRSSLRNDIRGSYVMGDPQSSPWLFQCSFVVIHDNWMKTAATSKTIPSLIFANGTHYSTSWRHSHQIKQILNISKMEWVVVKIAQMWVWRLTFGPTKVWLSCGLFEDIFLAQSQKIENQDPNGF